ncbi:MAG: FAD:protein FMN transferase [Micropruina sp.]|nr:MAG: FAD:protein FMN transferase [Micropruina sp.]
MGTVASIAGPVPEAALDEIRAAWGQLEERFSLYRDDSEASRLARHELPLTRASAEMRDAYALAQTWRADTEGAFSPQRPDGVIDLAGIVKSLAIAAAGQIIDAHGVSHWCVNFGGDLLARTDETARPWVAGIVDPDDRSRLFTQFRLSAAHPALATSGIAERGDHVWRIGTWDADEDPFVQVSVAGPDIVTADVLATAILSGGRPTLELATRRWPIEVIAVSRSGQVYATAAFRAAA